MAADDQHEVKGCLLVFPMTSNQKKTSTNAPPFTVEITSNKGEISFWRCNCGCNCNVLMPPTKNTCSRCGCPKRNSPTKGSWFCDCGCGCGVSMPESSKSCSSCGCGRRHKDPPPEGSWRCNCGCSCGTIMKNKRNNCSSCGCGRMCEKCMGSALSPDGTCKYCIKHANDPLPPSLLFNIQEDNNHMSLIQEKEKEGGGTGKESALQELNRKLKDINERMEAVDDQLREAQGCSTGQDFSLIGKLFMEKQQIEMELKSVTGVQEITFERKIIGSTFDLPPGITIFMRPMECCLTWCPHVEKIQETGTIISTAVPVVIEGGQFKCK